MKKGYRLIRFEDRHSLSAVKDIDLDGNLAYQLGLLIGLLAQIFEQYRSIDGTKKVRIYMRKIE